MSVLKFFMEIDHVVELINIRIRLVDVIAICIGKCICLGMQCVELSTSISNCFGECEKYFI